MKRRDRYSRIEDMVERKVEDLSKKVYENIYNDILKITMKDSKLDEFFFCCDNILERECRIRLFKNIVIDYLKDYNFYKGGVEKGEFVDKDLMQRAITSRIQELLQDLRSISHRNEYQKMMLKTVKDLNKILEKNQIILNDYLFFLR